MKTLRLFPVTRLWSAVGKTRQAWWPGELQLNRSLMCFALMKQVGSSSCIIFCVHKLETWNFQYFGAFGLCNLSCTDAAAQMRMTTADSPLSSGDNPEQTYSPSTTASLTKNMSSSSSFTPSPSSASSHVDSKEESALFVGSTNGSFGGLCLSKNVSYINKHWLFLSPFFPLAKAILITSACVLLLVAIIILVFLKLWVFSSLCFSPHSSWHYFVMSVLCFVLLFYLKRRRNVINADIKQPEEECIQTEECACVKNAQETRTDAQEDERIEVDNSCQTDV